MKRSGIRSVSKKRARGMRGDAKLKRDLIRERGEFCEARAYYPHDCNAYMGLDLHHILQRSLGGESSRENCVLICRNSHMWLHDNPAEATRLGLLAGRTA